MSHTLTIVAALLPGLLLLISEVLPFTKGKANGILHGIWLALTEAEKVLPPESK